MIASVLWPGLPSGLDAVCERLGIELPDRTGKHDAMDDVMRLSSAFVQMRRIYLERFADRVATMAIEQTEIEIAADASADEKGG